MKSKNTSVIALFGMSAHEVRVVHTICVLSKNAAHVYALQDELPSEKPDIAIVDKDSPAAMDAWQRVQANSPKIPAVMVSRQPEGDPSQYEIPRPLMATRLLGLLEQIGRAHERSVLAPQKTAVASVEAPLPTPPLTPPVEQQSAVGSYEHAPQMVALVVDNSLPVRLLLSLELKPYAKKVDLAEDWERAVQLIDNRRYDIVFLDVVLPGMDGYAICKRIRRDKRSRKTPVIMLTAKTSPFDRVMGKLAGCDDYLTKPVGHAAFEKVVRKYASNQQARESIEARGQLSGRIPERA